MDKGIVVVSRKWASPAIAVTVTSKDISMEMDLTEFLRTLVDITGNPTLLVTKAQHLKKLNEASEQIIEEMKRASTHV